MAVILTLAMAVDRAIRLVLPATFKPVATTLPRLALLAFTVVVFRVVTLRVRALLLPMFEVVEKSAPVFIAPRLL